MLLIDAQHIPAGSALLLMFDGPTLMASGENVDEVAYAMRMIQDAGFLDLTANQLVVGVGILGITWRGHDFLDSVRAPKIWQETIVPTPSAH